MGRPEREFEAYIRDTPIDHIEEVPIGVTHPKRAYFKSGGLVESVAWKILPPGRPAGYWESYKSEIAAYELDKLLGHGDGPWSPSRKNGIATRPPPSCGCKPIHSWKEWNRSQAREMGPPGLSG
jgi:hypothetical protein